MSLIRMISRAVPAACCTVIFAAHTAFAAGEGRSEEKETPWWEIGANVAVVSDYRFRGVSLSDESVALQGGFDVTTRPGFYFGFWGSSIESFAGSELETDFYGGYAREFNGVTLDAGFILYAYPGSDDTHYWEITSAVSGDVGPVGLKAGANYAFEQDNIGGGENIYVYADAEYGLPVFKKLPLMLNAHLGYEDGAFGADSFGEAKFDWSAGLGTEYRDIEFAVTYVDTNIAGGHTDAAVVFSVGASF